MSEELLQRDLIKNPEKIGEWNFYNIGATNLDALKKFHIIQNKDYKELSKRKPDSLITDNQKVIAVIENKLPLELKTKKQIDTIIKRWIPVCKKLKSKILIITDTKDNNFWINGLNGDFIKNYDNQNFIYKFNSKDEKIKDIIIEILDSIDEKNSEIKKPQTKNPTLLAKQIWQDIWVVSGATPENCLYTFVELFIFKYLSDLDVLENRYSFDFLLQVADKSGNSDCLKHYVDVIRPKIKDLFPKNDKDNTTIINGTIFVSKDQKAIEGYDNVFYNILKKFKEYGKLENIDYDFKSKIFESFLKESLSKKNWGQYFTPIKVVDAIITMSESEIKENISICDPACGVGKFLLQAIKKDINRFYKIENNKLVSKINIKGFDKGFDTEEQKTIILAKANQLIYFSDLIKKNPNLTKEFSNLFNNSFELKTNSILGTLSEEPEEKYDLILTNPPYVMSGSGNLKEEIRKSGLEFFYTTNASGIEGLFMEWIIRSIKKGGKAFVIVPDGILNRINDEKLRQFILQQCYLDGIISLPSKTFFTSAKKTYVIILTKKYDIQKKQTDPVFTYLCSSIGETLDINRFDIKDNDLLNATSIYNQFKGSKLDFKINDKRCKIQSIDKFSKNLNSWIIDKWWGEKELVKLGVIEKKEIKNIEEFIEGIESTRDDFAVNISDLKSISFEYEHIKYIEFLIKDIFEIEKGKAKYTKSYMNSNKGVYPVYSSQTSNNGIIGKINSYDYSNLECLTWTTDGTYVGTVFYRHGDFSMTTHCGALIPKKEYTDELYLPYIGYILNKTLPKYKIGEGSNKRLGTNLISDIKFKLPIINNNGDIDIEMQKELYTKFKMIDEIKNNIKNKLKELSNYDIVASSDK
jgi:type I restriction-modification system DNA methylase subunit